MEQADRLLGGRYALSDLLGYGGMAEVYRGTDVRLGRDVAVKVLRADLARDPSFLARFRREAQSAAGLSHPNIVSVYDTGEQSSADGTLVPFIVMEQVEGRTLRDVLKSEGRLVPRRAMEITAGVCAALEYSHGAGIIHRDIKPANVMITRAGDVKVMDFGIARAVAASQATMTQTAAVMGTAQYLSPEQARGEHVDARSDVYSTGCLLYELLTGRPPFSGDSPVAVAYQHVREDPVPPSQVDGSLGPEVDAIVLKAMAKNPGNRYQSAGEFGADLERAASGRRVSATPVLPAEATQRYQTGALPALATGSVQPVGGITYLDDVPDKRARRVVAYTLLALAVIGVFVGAALLVKSLLSTGQGSGIAMPNVTGRTYMQAQSELGAKGLSAVVVSNVNSDTVPANVVVKQDPGPGLLVNTRSPITLTISLGTKMVVIPDVSTQKQDAATAQLMADDLTIGMITPVDDFTKPAGTVISTSPAAGASVPHGSKVSLIVVSNLRMLPNTTTMTVADAEAALMKAGFPVLEKLQDDPGPPGLVLSQSPTTMTAQAGTQITIVVSQTPEPSPSPTPSDSPDPSLSPSPTPTATTTRFGSPTPSASAT